MIALVPVIVIMFLGIHNHYERVRRTLSLEGVSLAAGRAAEVGAVLSLIVLSTYPGTRMGPLLKMYLAKVRDA